MRVLMVTSFPIPGEYDGTAMLPIKILRALKPRGVDVVVAYLRFRPATGLRARSEDFEGTPVFNIPPAGWICGSVLRRIARKLPFDVVHAQHYGGATRAYAACHRNGWPLVYEIHSLLGDEVERKRLGRGLVFRSYLAVEQRLPARCASHRAGRASQAGCRHGEGRSGRPGERDLSGHRPRRVRASRQTGVNPRRATRKQGYHVRRQHRPPQPGRADFDRGIAADLRVPAQCSLRPGRRSRRGRRALPCPARSARRALIVLTGQAPDQVVALSRRADVLVHPRLACRENYSVQSKIAVYLAAGRPIVATDFGDYQHLLGRSGAGLLTPVAADPLAEAILRVLADPELAASLAAACGPVAREHFAMDRNIDRYLDVYQRAIALGPR